jgi:hypothetical protein
VMNCPEVGPGENVAAGSTARPTRSTAMALGAAVDIPIVRARPKLKIVLFIALSQRPQTLYGFKRQQLVNRGLSFGYVQQNLTLNYQ